MKHHKITIFCAILIALCLCISGCMRVQATSATSAQAEQAQENTPQTPAPTVAPETTIDVANMFTGRDMETDFDAVDAEKITLTGESALCDSDAVRVSGSVVTILDEGTFVLSGELNDGMIIVDADKTDKIRLVLNGVSVTSQTSAPIYVRQADKVFITLADGTENVLANGGQFVAIDENNIDSVIFSKDDLTLNGDGALSISSPAGHGVVSKDDLVITSGSFDVTCLGHGLSGNDSVRIAGASLVINSGNDAIHAENNDDATLGFVFIATGSFILTSGGDSVSAQSALQIDGGDFTIKSGSGEANSSRLSDESSAKGLKATGALIVNGGSFSIDASDDALHSNGSLAITGGEMHITSGDDGIHADGQVSISGGTIHISQSYEGIEGLSVLISGGSVSIVASDDGLNAAGGVDQSGFGGRRGRDMFMADSNASITITGGVIYINADGDGIDSNGSLTVTGGETYVSGPERNGNGAIDSASQPIITGGVFVAAGASGMAQGFGSSSEQGAAFVMVDNQPANSAVSLTDNRGGTLINWQSDKSFSSVVVSCPEMVQGGVYTLTAGTYEKQFTLESLVYSEGGMGGRGFGGGRGMGGRGGFGRGADRPEGSEGWPERGEDWPERGEDWPDFGDDWPKRGEDWPDFGEDSPGQGEDEY